MYMGIITRQICAGCDRASVCVELGIIVIEGDTKLHGGSEWTQGEIVSIEGREGDWQVRR